MLTLTSTRLTNAHFDSEKFEDFCANESLTPPRSTIMYVLRKMKREANSRMRGCSTMDGSVYVHVKQSENAPDSVPPTKLKVNTLFRLQDLRL